MRTVAIYKTGILPATQTFIPAQTNALRIFRPCYVGIERVASGYQLQQEPIVLIKDKSLLARGHKVLYKLTGYAPRFVKRVAAAGPSLMHAHFVLDGIHALRIAADLDLPLIVTLHGHIPTNFGKALPTLSLDNLIYSQRLHKLWRKAQLFICVSHYIRERALQLGYPEEKLRVHYIGIDRRMFHPSEQPRDPNLVLFVGRLVEKKGCAYLLRAMARVKQEAPEARVVIIGGGNNRAALEQLAKDLQVRAEFLGERTSGEILSWLQRARVFVAPSVTASDGEAEALGMVFLEAQATGLPVVSFLHGGIPEVVRHGETGLLAPERDTRTLSSYILRFLKDDDFWRQCSERAVDWVEQQFDLVMQTRELEKIYASLSKEASVS